MEADGADRTGDDRGRGKAAGVKASASVHFAFDDGFLSFEVAFDGGVLPDRETSFGVDIAGDCPVENKIGGTIQISFDLDVAR